MDVIQCYAPTSDGDEQDKEEFYSRLLTIIQDRPERNVIGSDNRGLARIWSNDSLASKILAQTVWKCYVKNSVGQFKYFTKESSIKSIEQI